MGCSVTKQEAKRGTKYEKLSVDTNKRRDIKTERSDNKQGNLNNYT